ncbi:MAG: hypothetical protein E7463_12720, partial [Ruminococcaceae bacterium]|nr:hypothetical protein [Oscillospiraceae bacterium]
MNRYAQLALEEYNSDTKTVRRAGDNGKPFWNVNASQFMFVPQLLFPQVPGALEYVYTARDSRGGVYSFNANNPIAALTPIWKDIAPGYVEITVEGINFNTGKKYLSGTRLIFKTAPFPGREELPERACSYREAALLGLRYVFNDPTTRYWLEHGVPDPEYAHNAYPTKMIASIVEAMLAYASIEPEHADEA